MYFKNGNRSEVVIKEANYNIRSDQNEKSVKLSKIKQK